MNMKLNASADLLEFLRAVKTCAGEVTFRTPEGDVLNLKSLLSQYLFASLAGSQELLAGGWVEYECPQDRGLLLPFRAETEGSASEEDGFLPCLHHV